MTLLGSVSIRRHQYVIGVADYLYLNELCGDSERPSLFKFQVFTVLHFSKKNGQNPISFTVVKGKGKGKDKGNGHPRTGHKSPEGE